MTKMCLFTSSSGYCLRTGHISTPLQKARAAHKTQVTYTPSIHFFSGAAGSLRVYIQASTSMNRRSRLLPLPGLGSRSLVAYRTGVGASNRGCPRHRVCLYRSSCCEAYESEGASDLTRSIIRERPQNVTAKSVGLLAFQLFALRIRRRWSRHPDDPGIFQRTCSS